MSRDDVIPDLIRAANGLNNLTCLERHILLSRAAEAISDYRDALNIRPTNNMGSGDIVFDLYCMAYSIELHAACAISEALLEAAAAVRTLRIDAVRVRRVPTP